MCICGNGSICPGCLPRKDPEAFKRLQSTPQYQAAKAQREAELKELECIQKGNERFR